ncbi:MAG: amidase [SAR324 cluster bacterium]|nr:amidase [SAR324 cluster bacterium]
MSALEELTALPLHELAARIAAREISPVEATQAYLDRIERLDGRYRAFISVYPDQALAAARQAEQKQAKGHPPGPLHGVPLAVKDLFQAEGMKRTCGSKVFREAQPAPEATSVTRLKAAGGILLGLLNLHEFAFGPTGVNPHFGTALNPWAPERVCGGSSSGAGGAVAGSLIAGALGSDTGGSIRIPAALCGVVGLKQTFGLASRHGIYPLCGEFDHGGPLARTVRDAALLLQAIAGEDPEDPTTLGAQAQEYSRYLEGGLQGVRIGVPANYFFDDLHPEVDSGVRKAIAQLAELGAEVREVSLPFMEEVAWAWEAIALPEALVVHEEHLRTDGERLSPDVRARLERSRKFSAVELIKARHTHRRVRAEMEALLTQVDVLATPTVPIPAVPVESGRLEEGGRTWDGPQVLGRLTRLACFTGQPAISLPCGMTSGGLPVGLQLMGGWFSEALLLRVAHGYEQATEWHRARPFLTPT